MAKRIFIIMILGLMLTLTVNSCKDPASPKATVTVRNGFENDALLEGAIVTVYVGSQNGKPGYVDPENKIKDISKLTDASGRCDFEFNLQNILQVKAEFPVGTDTLYGEGVLVLKEDKTYEETVYLRKYKSQL